MKNKLIAVLSASVVIGFSANVFADPTLDAGALQQQIEKEAPDVFTSPLPSVGAPEAPAQADDGVQILIHGVRLQGVQLVNEHELLDRLAPSLEKSYSLQGLQKLVDVVTAFYSERGFVIQAYLPQQSIDKDGIVTIQVLEAKLGDVKVENINDQARLSNEKAANYIKAQMPVGQPLNANLVSKGMVLLNELPGIKVVSAMEAGDRDGETNIHLSLKRTSLIDARIETKNAGSRSTGVAQAVASLTANSPFKLGDQASFYGLYSEGSNFNQVNYSLPIGYRGLRLAMTANYLDYENIGSYKTNGGLGHAWVLGANLSYPVKRSQDTNANLTFGFEEKGYLNRNLATDAINSRYTINNITLGANANRYDGFLGGGMTSATTSLVFGHLNIDNESPISFGKWQDVNGYHQYVPNNFTKLTFNASRIQFLPLENTQLNINVSGQLSADNLNSSEQFYLGGPYGVRAYPVAQGNGSQGFLASVEVQKRLPQNLVASVFLDAGSVQQYKDTYPGWRGETSASNSYELYGAGLGLKWISGHWNLSSVVAWKLGHNPLKTQTGLSVDNDGTDTSPRAWLNASYTF